MSANSLTETVVSPEETGRKKPRSRWWLAIVLPVWALVGFGVAQILTIALVYVLNFFQVPLGAMSQSVFATLIAAVVYLLSLVIIVGLPWWLKKYRTTKEDIGMTRLLSWMDIFLAPAGFVVYFLVAAILVYVIGRLVPGFNATQAQETGFNHISQSYEYLLAFITLIIVAPVAEELLFRGFLYGKLRKVVPVWVAILITSAVFGAIHGQWNVGVDVFVLSVVLCSLREITGNIWAGMLLHMIKNGLAFYVLFINPLLSHTIGG